MAYKDSDFEEIIAEGFHTELKLVTLAGAPATDTYKTEPIYPAVEDLLRQHDLFLLKTLGTLDPDAYDEAEDRFITDLEAKLNLEQGTDILAANVGLLAVRVNADVELAWDITGPDAAVAGYFAGLWAGGWYDAPTREELVESSDKYLRENGVLLAIDNGHLHADGGIYEIGPRAYLPLNYGKLKLSKILPR